MTQPIQPDQHLTPDQLSALIDEELSSSEAHEMQQHLVECHPCALRVLAATQLKVATARAAQRFVAPPETLARLAAQLRPQEKIQEIQPKKQEENRGKKTISPASFRPAMWAAIAAAFVLAISLIGWRQSRQSDTLAAELLDQHLAALSSGAAPEVISTDRHTVKPWFQGKLPFSFNLPETLPADTSLTGGDLAYLHGQPAALLLFTIHKHEVSVFLTQLSESPVDTVPPGARSGFTIRHAVTRDLRILAVSDVNPAELDLLVSALVAAQAPH